MLNLQLHCTLTLALHFVVHIYILPKKQQLDTGEKKHTKKNSDERKAGGTKARRDARKKKNRVTS